MAVSGASWGMAGVRGRGVRGARVAACVACVALLLWLARGAGWAGAGRGGARAALSSRREFPLRAPADIAHRLADFSTLPHALSATPGSWRVEEERGNFSTWSYVVEWECGPRCAGWARVQAEALAAVGHAAAREHRVALHVRTCTRPAGAALLSWSPACDEMEIAAEVESDGADGAVLRESARSLCGTGAGVGAGEAAATCEASLRAHRAQHHAILEGSI